MMPPRTYSSVYVFDLDNTLAESKQAIDSEMASLLGQLLACTNVAVISGGKFEQLEQQVAKQLAADTPLEHLYILPTSGGALFIFDTVWKKRYEEKLLPEEVERIEDAIEQAVQETGVVDLNTPSYGERIESRDAEVTFSALGQQAPIEEKRLWDPDMSKRRTLQEAIMHHLPGFDIKLGGVTSIDITKHGVNKAFGIRKLSEYTEIPIADMLYVGDQLRDGGNDEIVKETGIQTQEVATVEDTKKFIRTLL